MYKEITVIPTLTLDAYVANDCVGGLLTFDVDANTNNINIKRVTVIDAAVQDEEYNLHLYTASGTAGLWTDAEQYLPVASDLATKVTTINIAVADYKDSTCDSIAEKELDLAVVLTDNATLYGMLECVATPDYVAVDDLTVKMTVEIR